MQGAVTLETGVGRVWLWCDV